MGSVSITGKLYLGLETFKDNNLTSIYEEAVWSSGMILASGAISPGFNSQNSPFCLENMCS